MKRIIGFFFALVSLSAQAQTTSNFTISGTATTGNLSVAKVYLQYQSEGNNTMDSSDFVNGKYSFKGNISEPVLARIRVKYSPDAAGKMIKPMQGRDLISVFLSSGDITINSIDSFSNITVNGSVAQDDYTKLTKSFQPLNEQMNGLYKQFEEAGDDEAKKKAIEDKADSLDKLQKKMYADFVTTHPNSPIALYCVNVFAGWDINPELVAPLYAKLPATTQQSFSGKNLGDRIAIARKTAIGNVAPEFVQNDTLGNPIALSSFRGKYVLVDFWASWCGPCRRENPMVVKAFQQFQAKGFTIVGVSLDQPGAKEKWMDAIHKDALTWTHVSDLKYWENEVAKQYGIRAIPQNFLLDPSGKIIAKNLNGETLEKKLTELFTK
jgi:peroxiredoxin